MSNMLIAAIWDEIRPIKRRVGILEQAAQPSEPDKPDSRLPTISFPAVADEEIATGNAVVAALDERGVMHVRNARPVAPSEPPHPECPPDDDRFWKDIAGYWHFSPHGEASCISITLLNAGRTLRRTIADAAAGYWRRQMGNKAYYADVCDRISAWEAWGEKDVS